MRSLKIVTVVVMIMALAIAPGCGVQNTAQDSPIAAKELSPVLDSLLKEGLDAAHASNYPTALAKWEAGLNQARTLNDRIYISVFLGNLGIVYKDLGQYPQALQYLEQALAIAREIGHQQGERATLTNLGMVYEALGQYPQALQYLEQALAFHREIGSREGEETALGNLGIVYTALGQYERALASYKQALAIAREISNRRGEGAALGNLGIVYRDLGQYERALASYKQALAIAREISDQRGEGASLHNIGIVYSDLGQYKRALASYEQALAIEREIGNRGGEGGSLHNIGIVYSYLGQYPQALELYEQSLAIAREIGNRRGEGNVLAGIGIVYKTLTQYPQALEYFEQTLEIAREIGDRPGEGASLTNIGIMYSDLGQYERALAFYKQALAIDREIGDRRGEGGNLTNIGLVYQDLGQYHHAYTTMQDSIAIHTAIGNREFLWRGQRGLAEVEVHLKHFESAMIHYEQALETIEQLRAGLAEKEHKLSFMQDKIGVYDELITLLHDLHHQHPDRGYDRKALEIFERKQGRGFLEEMGHSGARRFGGMPEALTQQGLDLDHQLHQTRAQLADERAKPLSEQQHKLLQTLEERENTLLSEQTALQAQITTDYPEYAALRYPQPVALDTLQQQVLQPGELMLVYGVMREKTCLWVIGRETFGLYTLDVGEEELAEQVEAFRDALQAAWQPDRALFVVPPEAGQERVPDDEHQSPGVQISQELSHVLIPEAVRTLLPDHHTLTIVPTGPLYALPFEALMPSPPAPLGAGGSEGTPRYLIEALPINYLSSASLLKTIRDAQTRRTETARYPLVAFAHPTYKTLTLAPLPEDKGSDPLQALRRQAYQHAVGEVFVDLPETAEEVQAIAAMVQAPDASNPLHLRDKASIATVAALNQEDRLEEYHYLVFATHGVLPGELDYVTQPALVLSDDFLTMADVFALQLNANLVALSACNTGRGTQVRGEGVMGLTRAFMYAGTPAVAVTLWSVESLSAKDLDIGLFRHLTAGLSPAKALQAIKVQMLRGDYGEQYRHPYYWAPFVLFGDGRGQEAGGRTQ